MIEDDKISRSVLNKTFPFFFTVDAQLVIRDAGKSLFKVRKDLIQRKFEEVFEVLRPGYFQLDYKSLCKSEGKVFLLAFRHLDEKVLYKGQVIVLKSQRRVLFIGSPFVRELNELPLLNLSLNDFSISDSTVDMLQLLQVNKMVNDDMKELNRRLKLKEEKYRNIVEEAKEIIFTTDVNGSFTYMNDLGINVIGIDEDELLDTNFSHLVDQEHIELIMSKGRELLRGEVDLAYVEFPLNSHENLWIGQNMTLLKTGNKKYGFQGVARDITEKVNYEKIIVGEKEKAQIATKEKSRFLANMSHEIRTPLNGIMGLTNLLLDTEITDKQKKYLSAITSSSETLMVVINDILDISKIDAQKLKISNHPFNIKTSITQLVDMLSVKALEKGIMLNYEERERLPESLVGDEPRLNQILYNIVGNAIKFTQKGAVTISIDFEQVSEEEVLVRIEVKDSGIGIDESKIDHVFKAFGQIDENDSREFQGTGLGLTIASKLINLHKGTIDVSSELGIGSVFTIRLPYKLNTEQVSGIEEAAEGSLDTSISFDGFRFLLAEDNPINQMVTRDLLENKGAQVALAGNGQEAIQMLIQEDYSAVLMDMQMPILDGYSAMKIIRETPRCNKIPILALTAHVSAEEESKCKSSGADDYLSKPFKPSELFRKIKWLIRNKDEKLNFQKETSDSQLNGASKKQISRLKCDFSLLYEFTNHNKEIIVSTLHLLRSVIPNDMVELRYELSLKNYERIKAIAHRSKPNFKLVLSRDSVDLMGEIERLAEHSENHQKLQFIVSEIELKEQDILTAIDKELELM